MKRTSQKDKILRYLKSGKKITPAIAYEKFGCLRLSERIREINKIIPDLKNSNFPALKYHWKDMYKVKKGWKQVNKYTRVREYSL